MTPYHEKTAPPIIRGLIKLNENIIFNVRWLLNLFYLGLIVVLFMYGYTYVEQIWHLLSSFKHLDTDEMKIIVLDTVDVVMVANLVKMIIAGSYNSFISKMHGYSNENISSGMLKIKISTSIVVVGSIHLLKEFVKDTVNWDIMQKQLWLYGAFLVSALILGLLEYLHIKSEAIEHEISKANTNH